MWLVYIHEDGKYIKKGTAYRRVRASGKSCPRISLVFLGGFSIPFSLISTSNMAFLPCCSSFFARFLIFRLSSGHLLPGSFNSSNHRVYFPTRISPRAGSCPGSDYSPCAQGLPDNFCCPSNTYCLALADNTTGLCCPNGSDCSTVQPVNCTVTLQDASTSPTANIHTKNLTRSLPLCDSGCCPFGYHCEDSNCVLDKVTPGRSSQSYAQTTVSTLTPSTTPETTTTVGTKTYADQTTPAMVSSEVSGSASPSNGPLSTNPKAKTSSVVVVAMGSTVGACSFTGLFLVLWMKWSRRRRPLNVSGRSTSWKQLPLPSSSSQPRRSSTVPLRATLASLPQAFIQRFSDMRKIKSKCIDPELSAHPRWYMGHTKVSPPKKVIACSRNSGPCSPVELPATPLSLSFWTHQGHTVSKNNKYGPASRQEWYELE
ncbi:hypothetical protein F5Y15DRAFT_374115 [Xylariaceae sp. FL0016]|nr:hypothetical protein F5Y15DRAFT_374115 [Xylariaceae sp. FL0016]